MVKPNGPDQIRKWPLIRLAFQLPEGVVVRDITMADIESGKIPGHFRPGSGESVPIDSPDWITEPQVAWDRPQDPVTYSGVVVQGREDEAWAVLQENLEPVG